MKIPSSFYLFGSKYTVEVEKNHQAMGKGEGIHSYSQKKITLQGVSPGNTEDACEHAYLHELVHAILSQMGEHDLNGRENFVDIFSGLLHQSIKTSEYPCDPGE